LLLYVHEVHGGAFGLGSVLQAGRLQVLFAMGSLISFIDLILLAALWPWARLGL